MRIFELLNQSAAQQLDPNTPNDDQEDDPQTGKFNADGVENSLQDVAQTVQDRDAQPDLPNGAQQQDPTLDNDNAKPIDSALLGQIRTLSYATKYQHGEKDKMNPLNIAAQPLDKLYKLKDNIRYKIQMMSMKNQIAGDEDDDMQYLVDLRQFVNTVISFKKTNTSAQLAATNPTPAYQTLQRRK